MAVKGRLFQMVAAAAATYALSSIVSDVLGLGHVSTQGFALAPRFARTEGRDRGIISCNAAPGAPGPLPSAGDGVRLCIIDATHHSTRCVNPEGQKALAVSAKKTHSEAMKLREMLHAEHAQNTIEDQKSLVGIMQLPTVAKLLAGTKRLDAIVCVYPWSEKAQQLILHRGIDGHIDTQGIYFKELQRGLQDAALDTGVPMISHNSFSEEWIGDRGKMSSGEYRETTVQAVATAARLHKEAVAWGAPRTSFR